MNSILLRTINERMEGLKKLLPMKEEYQHKLDNKFRLEFNYNSNHLEGNTLTMSETMRLLAFDETDGEHTLREYEEMKGHDWAFELVKKWAIEKRDSPLTEIDIKNLNKAILVKPFWKDAITSDNQNTRRLIKVGEYKELPNSVKQSNGEIFQYTSPQNTPVEMGELMQWFRDEEEKKDLHPVELAALFHYRFVRIHPFDDGIGRISRLLVNYFLIKADFPPIVIKSEDKKNYLSALRKADSGDLEAFVDYLGEQLLWSLDISIKAARGENIDEPGDLDKKLSFLKKQLGINAEKITEKKSREAVIWFYENNILPFAKAWEELLKKFDPLFYSRKMRILVDNYTFEGTDFEKINPLETLISLKDYSIRNIGKITLEASPKGLVKSKNDREFNGGSVDFWFYENRIEIGSSEANSFAHKLYNEKLTEVEIENLTEDLGNWLYHVIESSIEEK